MGRYLRCQGANQGITQARALRKFIVDGTRAPPKHTGLDLSARAHLDPPYLFFLYDIRRGIAVPGIMIAEGVVRSQIPHPHDTENSP